MFAVTVMPKTTPKKKHGTRSTRQKRAPQTSSVVSPQINSSLVDSDLVSTTLMQSMIAAVVPAVTDSVMASLRQMGVVPALNVTAAAPPSEDNAPAVLNPIAVTSEPVPGPSHVSATPVMSPSVPSGSGMSPLSRPVDMGVDPKVKGKIWADQFIEFGTLLSNREGGALQLVEGADGTFVFSKSKPAVTIKTLPQWFRAFHVFVAIYTSRFPESAPQLMKYADTMQRLSHQAGEQCALQYDRQFRQWRQDSPSLLSWDHINPELYNSSLASGLCQKVSAKHTFRPQTKPAGGQQKICYMYNNHGTCTRVSCSFAHTCSLCRGPHPRRVCAQHVGQSSSPGVPQQTPSAARPKSFNKK